MTGVMQTEKGIHRDIRYLKNNMSGVEVLRHLTAVDRHRLTL